MNRAEAEHNAMRRAIVLSAMGLGSTSPNPPVGCVILDSQGQVVGEGFHRRKGAAHAEVNALEAAGSRAVGGTAVVTLEPCNHYGRTPPCRKALIDAGVTRVVVGVLDPTSREEGGANALRVAGVGVEVGILTEEVRLILDPWLVSLRLSRPFVTWLSTAQAYDGDPEGADAIIQPGRVVLGAHLAEGDRIVSAPKALDTLYSRGARLVRVSGDDEFARPFFEADLVDRALIVVPGQPSSLRPASALSTALPSSFRVQSIERAGTDVKIMAYRERRSE